MSAKSERGPSPLMALAGHETSQLLANSLPGPHPMKTTQRSRSNASNDAIGEAAFGASSDGLERYGWLGQER